MSPLRQRMDEAMVLRGLAERTREAYLMCVRALAKHYRRRPDELSGAELQAFTERKLAYASVNQAA